MTCVYNKINWKLYTSININKLLVIIKYYIGKLRDRYKLKDLFYFFI